jgi:Tfp pilus assembly protein FimT
MTLTEVSLVAAMILIVAGLSLPSIAGIMDHARLRSAAAQLASFYQQSRIRATQDNNYYEVLLSSPGTSPVQACLDLNGDGVCNSGEPQVQLPSSVTVVASSNVPVPLDPAMLAFVPLDTSKSNMYDQQDNLVPGLAWNGRALPCQRTSPTSACSPVGGWVEYLQLGHAPGKVLYAAVTVSPTGRIKSWTYSPGGSRSWN